MRSKRSRRVGPADLALLAAISAGEVVRDDCAGKRRGLWALYVWGGVEVGQAVRRLRRLELVVAPLLGPPQLTAEGRALLARDS